MLTAFLFHISATRLVFCSLLRNGLGDPRAIPKKAGAGNGNWGVLGVEVKDLEQDSFTG